MNQDDFPLEHDREGLSGGYGGGTGVGEPGIDPAAEQPSAKQHESDFSLEAEREAETDGAGRD
jgi:hypothetical protein